MSFANKCENIYHNFPVQFILDYELTLQPTELQIIQIVLDAASVEMFERKQAFVTLLPISCLILFAYYLPQHEVSAARMSEYPTKNTLLEKSLKMLDKISKNSILQINTKFTLLLAEFLIKRE